jgi:hypothetical protein
MGLAVLSRERLFRSTSSLSRRRRGSATSAVRVCLLSPVSLPAAAAAAAAPRVALAMADAADALSGFAGSNLHSLFSLNLCFSSLALSVLASDWVLPVPQLGARCKLS